MIKKPLRFMFLAIVAQLAYGEIAKASDVTEMETGTVVISATRTEQFLEDVPQTMEVVTAEEIEQMGATNIEQVFSKVPGVLVTNGRDPLVIRGSGLADVSSPLLLIDGRQPPYYETKMDGLGTYLDSINIANIERIEIIKGQAGAIYGADALNGVINIITKKGGREAGGLVNLSVGNSESSLSAFYDFGQVGRWDGTLSAAVKKRMGLKEDYNENSTYYDRGYSTNGIGATYNIAGNLGFSINEDHRLSLNAAYTQEAPVSMYEIDGTETRTASTVTDIYSTTLAYDGQTENHMFKLDAGFTHNYSSYDMGTYTANGQDTWFFNDWNALTVGFQYRLDTQNNNTDVLNAGYIDRSSLGIFVQDEISLLDEKLFLIPAIRYDYNSSFDGALTYQLGGTYKLTPNQRLKASFGTAYSAPILSYTDGAESRGNDGYATHTEGQRVIGSQELKPLEGYAWEIAYEGEFGNLTGSIAYFYKMYDGNYGSEVQFSDNPDDFNSPEYIGLTSDPRNPYGAGYRVSIRTYTPLDTTTQGIDFNLAYDFLENFRITAAYNWLDKRQEGRSERLGDYAEHTYTFGLGYNNAELGLNVDLWGKYMQNYGSSDNYFLSTYDTKNGYGDPYVFDYYDVNFAISKIWAEKYTTTFAVYNLLTSSRSTTNDSYVNPLTFTLGLSVKF